MSELDHQKATNVLSFLLCPCRFVVFQRPVPVYITGMYTFINTENVWVDSFTVCETYLLKKWSLFMHLNCICFTMF